MTVASLQFYIIYRHNQRILLLDCCLLKIQRSCTANVKTLHLGSRHHGAAHLNNLLGVSMRWVHQHTVYMSWWAMFYLCRHTTLYIYLYLVICVYMCVICVICLIVYLLIVCLDCIIILEPTSPCLKFGTKHLVSQ